MSENRQFTEYEHIDNLRKELENKIEKKASDTTFKWIIGGMAALLLASASFVWNVFAIMNSKFEENVILSNKEMDKIRDRVLILETKIK